MKRKKIVLYAILMSLIVLKTKNGIFEPEDDIWEKYFEELDQEISEEVKKVLDQNDSVSKRKVIIDTITNFEKEIPLFLQEPTIIANTNVNIRKSPNLDAPLAGKLWEGCTLELLDELDNWYKVRYYNQDCFVSKEFTSKITKYKINRKLQKTCYISNEIAGDVTLTIPKEISETGKEEIKKLSDLEFLEIYQENDDTYLVETADFIGYVEKTSKIKELTDTFVVVGLSDQEVIVYENNEVVLESPVVTGSPSTPTDEGLFEIYEFKKHDYLRGEDYASYVDIMMKYNYGEGFHDAEYHYCENGEDNDHGWRLPEEFGGKTYLINGSHGCVNMPHDQALKLYRHVSLGTKVLVKP